MLEEVVIFESTSKTSKRIFFGTNVKYDLIACSSQEMQFWCRCHKNMNDSKRKVIEDFLSFLTVIYTPDTINDSGVMISVSWGCAAEINFRTGQDTWRNLELESTSNEKLEEP
jgi:hypothetical protein